MSQNWIDGNAMAGPLRDLFTVELTAAVGTCASCEARAALAEAVVFDRAPGLVARCAGCGAVLVRLVTGENRVWLDARGLGCLEFHRP